MSANTTQSAVPWDDSVWAHWAIGLVEPLLDPHARVATVETMRAQATRHRQRSEALLAGVFVDLVDSLPESDVWRRVDPDRFGTWRSGTDLVPLDNVNIGEDIGLAALAEPLPDGAVRMFAAAPGGFDAVLEVCAGLDDVVIDGTRAISWASWRRRAYLGVGETYPVLAVFSWLRRAELISAGKPLDDEAAHERQRVSARIDEEPHY